MKKGIRFLTIMFSAAVLAGCGSSEPQAAAGQVTKDIQEAPVETVEAVTEEYETEESESESVEEETGEAEMELAEGGPDLETLTQMFDGILDWAGLIYMQENPVDIQMLTVQEALPMVGQAIATQERTLETGEVPYDMMTGIYTISPETADKWAQKYFGQSYDISELVSDGTYGNTLVSAGENGDLMVSVGDWGLAAPIYEFAGITEMEDGKYVLSVYYSIHDYEEDTQSEPKYHMEYTLEKNEASDFGYVITDVVGTSL